MRRYITSLFAAVGLWLMASAQQPEPSDSLVQALQEVVVTAKQPATKLVGSTLVSTIVGSPLQNLGTALDVLAQLPMLKVADRSVTVIGKGSPEIYIDGRPMHDDDELLRLQSSNIKKVELVMAPGAMYDSEAAAILKITTRNNFIKGLSFTEYAMAEQKRRFSYNEMLSLNYRLGHWDIFASGMVGHYENVIKGESVNYLEYDGLPAVVGGSNNNSSPTTVGTVRAGFNYGDSTLSFGAYYRYNPEKVDFTNNGSEWYNDTPEIRRVITQDIHSHSHLVSLYFDKTFSEKYILHFDGDFKSSDSRTATNTVYPDAQSADVSSRNKRHSTLWAGKLYFKIPLAKGDLTFGTQDSYTHTNLDFLMQNTDVAEYIPSSITDARQTALAAFATWSRSFGKFSLNAGLRYEYVDYRFYLNDVKDNNVSRRDNLLTPDISLGYFFSDNSQIGLSYKMSTVKPSYSQLTGSLNYVGRHEIEGGNPALRDGKMHDIQLFGMWNGFILQADYTRTLDSYAFVKKVYPADDLQLLMQPINDNISSLSCYLVWSKPVKRWTPEITVGMYKQWLNLAGNTYNKPIFSYYLQNVISLPYDFLITVNCNGQSQGDMQTNRFGASWFVMDASVSKSFFNKSLQLKIAATDIFNTRSNDWSMNTYGIQFDKRLTYNQRGISLTVTYNFHPRQSKYKGDNASQQELNRL